jgi:hypothetical protein
MLKGEGHMLNFRYARFSFDNLHPPSVVCSKYKRRGSETAGRCAKSHMAICPLESTAINDDNGLLNAIVNSEMVRNFDQNDEFESR